MREALVADGERPALARHLQHWYAGLVVCNILCAVLALVTSVEVEADVGLKFQDSLASCGAIVAVLLGTSSVPNPPGAHRRYLRSYCVR